MKYLITFLSAALFFVACGPQSDADTTKQDDSAAAQDEAVLNFYGDSISPDGAISTDQLMAAMEKDGGFEGKVNTVIQETCQKKGCWMKVDVEGADAMRVSFIDYSFFVPTGGVEGREVIMEGKAYYDTTSVEMLRHFAEDAGKSEDEIAAITEPEYALSFEATGVIIKE